MKIFQDCENPWLNVNVLYDSVIVKIPKEKKKEEDEEYTKSSGGIIMKVDKAEKKKKLYGIGEVVCVGNGYHSMDGKGEFVPLCVKVGDYIVINITDPANGNIIHEDEDSEYRLIREQGVLMKTNSNLSPEKKAEIFIDD